MYRRLLCMLLAVGFMFFLAIPAKAAGQGEITVTPHHGQTLVWGGEVALYRVGTAVEEGFRLTGSLANWVVKEKDVLSQSFLHWLLDRLYVGGIVSVVKKNVGAQFGGLQEGLYLVMQKEPAAGYLPFSPFLLTLPTKDNVWQIHASPKISPGETGDNPQTADHFNPIFAAMIVAGSLLGLILLGEKRKK